MRVSGIEAAGGRYWHHLSDPVEMAGTVEVVVDADFRSMMAQLHTDTHILNALVFRQFQGALVTGAQLNEDGTARMDFDLPDADNDRLRALEPEINDVIRQDLPVRYATWGRPRRWPSAASYGTARWRRPPPRTARSGSWRSSGSTGRPAAGPTWPPPPSRGQCES